MFFDSLEGNNLRRMNDKKGMCKFDDYIEPRSPQLNLFNTCSSLSRSLAEFKLDRISPRNINIKLNTDGKENISKLDQSNRNRNSGHFKGVNCYQNKFYHQYLHMKEEQTKSKARNSKISHIFNIRSINLVEKARLEHQRLEIGHIKPKLKISTKQTRRNKTQKFQKNDFKGLNFLIIQKKGHSPEQLLKRNVSDKRFNQMNPKLLDNRQNGVYKNGDDKFQTKLYEYHQYLKEHCQVHGISMKQVEHYGKNTITFSVGKGNNGFLIKEMLKKRWWWTIQDDKNKKNSNLLWTQLKERSFYSKKEDRPPSTCSQTLSKCSTTSGTQGNNPKNRASSQPPEQLNDSLIHNHFQNNEYLGNKKALFYNMKAFYQKQNKNVFDYLPVTFHVKRYDDETWRQFTQYYSKDIEKTVGQRRLWIVKPGENSNRGNGITVYSDYEKIKQFMEVEISGSNNIKKTFIIQKYIDKPFLYNKRKFDIRCYMLLVRLNGSIKGYWYDEGYIRTSCYDYQVEDIQNTFIHLTNDAIQINCDKYGKYQDGNKLSYHNFQKYLDSQKTSRNFTEQICPQLKAIATDSVEACYHLLGQWNGLPTFQIFGLDFMIDQNFKPWLIEINTNPCLETGSTTQQRIIPRMVDSAFKLSLDLVFPPPSIWQNSKKHHMPNRIGNNLFQMIFDESKRSSVLGMRSDQIIIEMGEIEQDNQIYQQKANRQNNSAIA